jgi:hypothetical protein
MIEFVFASEQPDFSRATDKQEGTELLLVCRRFAQHLLCSFKNRALSVSQKLVEPSMGR